MARLKPRDPIVAIVGATGTGKSQVAVDLALKFNGEIINADAMQLYDGLPIITNKIPIVEQKGVPHHLLGCVSLDDQPWRADMFVKKALDTITEIRSRGRLPIVVGGTHYYTQSLLFKDALVDTQATNNNDEEMTVDEFSENKTWPILGESAEVMLQKLREVDPVMAARWHPKEIRRIRRSLQIWLQTGKKASDLYEDQDRRRKANKVVCNGITEEGDGESREIQDRADTGLRFPSMIFWVHVPREIAAVRLDARVDQMVLTGLLEEARGLEKYAQNQQDDGKPVDKARGIYAAVGYKEFRALLDAFREGVSESSVLKKLEEEGIEMTKIATRRYAKTQLRWIRTKLINALQEAGAGKSIMLLDASSPNIWTSTVLDPAIKLTEAFLDGEELVKDALNETSELLSPLREYDLGRRRELWQNRMCDTCKVTTVTEEDWQKHTHGSRHKRAIKGLQKKHRQAPVDPLQSTKSTNEEACE